MALLIGPKISANNFRKSVQHLGRDPWSKSGPTEGLSPRNSETKRSRTEASTAFLEAIPRWSLAWGEISISTQCEGWFSKVLVSEPPSNLSNYREPKSFVWVGYVY